MAKKTRKRPLTILQERFVNILFGMRVPNNRTAYIQAGYRSRGSTADVNACRLLKTDKVKSYLDKLRAEATERTGIDGAKVIKELGKLAFSNIKNYMDVESDKVYFKDFAEITDEQAAAIESIKVMKKIIKGKGEKDDDVEIEAIQFKLHSKTNTLEQLGKHLGVFEADNNQRGDKKITIINFNQRDDTKQIISGPAGPARITSSDGI